MVSSERKRQLRRQSSLSQSQSSSSGSRQTLTPGDRPPTLVFFTFGLPTYLPPLGDFSFFLCFSGEISLFLFNFFRRSSQPSFNTRRGKKKKETKNC
ncbi:hypothetical protein BDW59DRAFT_5038 [Aspergillus cavernicola]|uniref:Uncharacterized protein n=1 Tax=Aspergillus cavernicola TaxID=176166 RepID=A0ABR4J7Y1_9EURO